MGKKMGRRPASAVSMGLTGRKGSPGIIICDFRAVLLQILEYLQKILYIKFLFPAKKTLLIIMGISLTFLEYFLLTLCNTSTVFYFCAFISLVEITTGFHGWPICFSYWIQDKYILLKSGTKTLAFALFCQDFSYTVLNVLLFQGCFQPCGEEHVRVLILTQ